MDLEDLKEHAKSKNGKCLSEKYINNRTKYKWYCNKHDYQWEAKWGNINNGNTWCKYCGYEKRAKSNTKYNIEDLKEHAKSKNGKCINEKYLGYNKKHKWYCKKHDYFWYATWASIKKGTWCPKCGDEKIIKKNTFNYKYVKKYCKNKNIKVLDDKYTGIDKKMNFKCNIDGHEWQTSFNHIKNSDSGCPKCGKNAIPTIEEVKKYCKNKNIKVLDDKYINSQTKMDFKCIICNYKWKTTYYNIKRIFGCIKCNQINSENKAIEILEDLIGKEFKRNIYPKWLINPKTNKRLELDGYNEELKIAIEYQGGQHFDKDHYYNKSVKVFKDLQYRDRIKRKICKKRNIKLLEPDCNMTQKEILDYYKKKLNI